MPCSQTSLPRSAVAKVRLRSALFALTPSLSGTKPHTLLPPRLLALQSMRSRRSLTVQAADKTVVVGLAADSGEERGKDSADKVPA
eukprot:1161314-Pelagomonas_calceolata.AAC.5